MHAPLAQDFSIIWHNPDDRFYVEGCGLVALGGDAWLAAVPVIPRHSHPLFTQRATLSRTHLVRSSDGGRTWKRISEVPYYSAAPFLHGDTLYLFAFTGGTHFRNDDLRLLRSDDGGATWTDPVTLFHGHFWNCHTSMAVKDERIYWAVDDLNAGRSGIGSRGPCLVAGDLAGDLMRPDAWRRSNSVPFPGVPDALMNPRVTQRSIHYLEPNVIEVNGKLRVLAAVKVGGQSTTGLCAVLDADDDGKELVLDFTQYHPMPGGQLKFGIARDEPSGLFWAAVNLAVDGQGAFGWEAREATRVGKNWSQSGGNDRRFLMLMYGMDGLNWFPAGCIARAACLTQSFMYPCPVVAGDDLCVVSRTSIRAPNRHDADHATFHRIRNFRGRAMDLQPAQDAPEPHPEASGGENR